jgi:hypothetical protein
LIFQNFNFLFFSDDKRLIFWACVAKNMDVFKNIHTIAYDGDHILVSLDHLNFGGRGEAAEAVSSFLKLGRTVPLLTVGA